MTTARFNFLSSGPVWSCELPGGMDQLPTDVGTSVGQSNGNVRMFAGHSPIVDEAMFNGPDLVHTEQVTGQRGRRVDIFARAGVPPVWFARWDLKRGSLVTHLAPEERFTTLPTFLEHVDVVETRDGRITLLLSGPLQFSVRREPASQDLVYFGKLRDARNPNKWFGWGVLFRRPGAVPKGATQVNEEKNPSTQRLHSQVVVGSDAGIDVQVGGEIASSEARTLAWQIASSLQP
jgi:hypothetical protein